MKIMITGLAGMLGSNIAYELKENYSISGIDQIAVGMPQVSSFCFDMLDYVELRKTILQIKPEVIIHTAAAVNVDRCEMEPEYASRLNVELTKNICKIAHDIHAKIIYISTDAVFDGNNRELYSERDQVNPINVYGKTKLMGEDIVKQYDNNLILRTNIYGFNIQGKNSFGEWIYKSLLNDENLNMFDDIDFSPILVNDLADIIDKCIVKELTGEYHACGTGCITKYDFGCALKRIFQIDCGRIIRTQSDSFSFKARRSKHMGMDNNNLKRILACDIRTPIESITEFYRLYKEGYPDILRQFGGIADEN